MLALSPAAAPASISWVGAADLGNNGGTGTSYTQSYTVGTGSNRFLVVAFLGDVIGGADDITGVTYAGAAMTLLMKYTAGAAGNNRFQYVYGLANPASGANNVVISYASVHYILALAANYAGVAQGTPAVDGSGTNYVTATSLPLTFTTIAANDWGIVYANWSGTPVPGAYSGSGGYAQRAMGAQYSDSALLDSNAALAAGAQNVTITTGALLALGPRSTVNFKGIAFGLQHA
jgi:hypothetical protein